MIYHISHDDQRVAECETFAQVKKYMKRQIDRGREDFSTATIRKLHKKKPILLTPQEQAVWDSLIEAARRREGGLTEELLQGVVDHHGDIRDVFADDHRSYTLCVTCQSTFAALMLSRSRLVRQDGCAPQ